MGTTDSKTITTNATNQTFVSKTTMNTLNENINTAVASSLISNDSTCLSDVDIEQVISATGCKVGGDMNITGVDMKSVATVDFKCVSVSDSEQTMAQTMLSELMGEVQSAMDADSENKMDTLAETTAERSGILGGNSSATTVTNNLYDLTSISDSNTNIQNIIANNITAEFNVDNVQSCASKLTAMQAIRVDNCDVAGNLNISDISMETDLNAMSECLNEMGVAQDVINATAVDLGVIVESDAEFSAYNDMKTEAKTTAITTGITLMDCCGSMGLLLICCLLFVLSFLAFQYMEP